MQENGPYLVLYTPTFKNIVRGAVIDITLKVIEIFLTNSRNSNRIFLKLNFGKQKSCSCLNARKKTWVIFGVPVIGGQKQEEVKKVLYKIAVIPNEGNSSQSTLTITHFFLSVLMGINCNEAKSFSYSGLLSEKLYRYVLDKKYRYCGSS